MFAHTKDPSYEGRWTRLAPVAAALSVATGFALALIVLINATVTAHLLTARAQPAQQPAIHTTEQRIVVQNQAGLEAPDAGAFGG